MSTSSLFRTVATAALAFAAVGSIAAAPAAPSAPGAVVAPEAWTIDFKPGPLRLHVDIDGGRSYWYMTYQVVNRTGSDRMFAPRVELFSDRGELLRSGRQVPSRVTRDIMTKLGNPLLEDQNMIIGELLEGRENARDGIVIWPATDLHATELTVFVTGLSSEIETVPHPVTGEDVVLRKTLRRDYVVPGNVAARGSKPVEATDTRWIWR